MKLTNNIEIPKLGFFVETPTKPKYLTKEEIRKVLSKTNKLKIN
jgi:hypothetical protein